MEVPDPLHVAKGWQYVVFDASSRAWQSSGAHDSPLPVYPGLQRQVPATHCPPTGSHRRGSLVQLPSATCRRTAATPGTASRYSPSDKANG